MHNDQGTWLQGKTIGKAAPIRNGRNTLWRGVMSCLKINLIVAGAAGS
jgi:hypothetical protein